MQNPFRYFNSSNSSLQVIHLMVMMSGMGQKLPSSAMALHVQFAPDTGHEIVGYLLVVVPSKRLITNAYSWHCTHPRTSNSISPVQLIWDKLYRLTTRYRLIDLTPEFLF